MSSNMKFSCPAESVIDIIRSKRPECTWVQKESVGKGAQGEVFKVCCQETNECDYVVKFYESVQTTETAFKQEVNAHTEFEELGVAVPIIEAFYCPSHGSYIIMEKRQMSIKQYICHLYKKSIPQRIIFDVIDKLYDEVLPMLELAYDNNLLHGDSHLDNFMLDPVDEYDYANLAIIDFGKSGIMPNEDGTFDERHEKYNIIKSEGRFKSDSILVLNRETKATIIADLEMSFDMLKKAVKENRVCDSTNAILKAPEKRRIRSIFDTSKTIEAPAQQRKGLFDMTEAPAQQRKGLFDTHETTTSPAQQRKGLFDTRETTTSPSQQRKGLFDMTESPATPSPLKAPTDINRFRSIQPLSNRLFDSFESPAVKRSIPKYDDFKQL